MESAAYILSGLAAGVFSGALGIGGAVVATPLIRFAGMGPYLAIGSTVPAILPGTFMGAWTYFRARLVDTRAAATVGAAGGLFSFVGARTTRSLDGHVLMLLTAAVLFFLAVRLPKSPDGPIDAAGADGKGRPRASGGRAGLVLLGAVAGFFSGLLGLGGGFVIVPVLVRFFRFPIKLALGTSLAVIAVMAVPNIAGQSSAGNIDWTVALLLATGTIPGARIGALLAIKSSERALRLTVSVALSLLALVYAGVELAALSSRP